MELSQSAYRTRGTVVYEMIIVICMVIVIAIAEIME